MTLYLDHKNLKQWFLEQMRDLPWRTDRHPYRVWVSEVMLQQTQVSVVIPYFERWMERFPTIKHLAEASLDEVIKLWEGLGYYSRARNLHEGARYVLQVHEGYLPKEEEALKKIKGLGPYTIGAIRSFAFRQRTPAVDGNVLRVISRYLLIEEDIAKSATVKKIREQTEALLPQEEHWIINEALIELGATICTRTPKCRACPLKSHCKGFIAGVAQQLPIKTKNCKIESLYRAVAVIIAEEQVLVRRCGKNEIMSDLHEFPYFETSKEGITIHQLAKHLPELKLNQAKALPEQFQSFTRYRVKLNPVLFTAERCRKIKDFQWIPLSQLSQLAFSSGHKRILKNVLSLY